DCLDELGQQGRVSGAPDEARPDHHGLESVAGGAAHRLLRAGLGRRVERLRVGSQRCGLVDVHQRVAGEQRRLGPHVNETADAGIPGGGQRVLGPDHVVPLELLGVAPVPEVGRGVERKLAALGAGAHRLALLEVAPDRGGPGLLDRRGRAIGAGERADAEAVAHQPPDQRATDEPGPSGDERRALLRHGPRGEVENIEFIATQTEAEALLAEQNFIRQYRPRYNVRLRDDKSYPYIAISLDEEFPRVYFTREKHRRGRAYFGPFSNAKRVRETLDLLGKVFQYRTCDGAEPGRASGSPCLDYFIKRCGAPCVGYQS